MRRICIMYIDDGGNVVVVQLTGGQARGLKVANSIDRQGSVALTADGAVIQNKISNTNTDANTNTETHIEAQIQTGRNVGNSQGRPGRGWP